MRTPIHLWLVVCVATVWVFLRGLTFALRYTDGFQDIALRAPDVFGYFSTLPLWLQVIMAVEIIAGAVFVILLIRRRAGALRAAEGMFLTLLFAQIHQAVSLPARVLSVQGIVSFGIGLLLVAGFYMYARRQIRRGVLT
ncbi:MAG: hypothetical protein ACRBCL_06400 [Maritimibacter sp.]